MDSNNRRYTGAVTYPSRFIVFLAGLLIWSSSGLFAQKQYARA